jgi:hypothetical protein
MIPVYRTPATLPELKALVEEYGATEVFVYKASYSNIDDPVMHQRKNAYIDARQAVLTYLNDESVMHTPINEARAELHGWDGIATVADIAHVCEHEGFEYGLLHKSSFLGVDDPTVHALIADYANAHYALMEHLQIDCVRSTSEPFVPLN